MNHFFALPIPPAIQEELGKLAEEWQNLPVGRASWYAPADYHITLKFLGDMDPSRQPELIGAALPVAIKIEPFEVDLNASAGGFPNLLQPRVLWAGVKQSERMAALAGEIDKAMNPLGFPREKRGFTPHITLARVKPNPPTPFPPGRGSQSGHWLAPAEYPFPLFMADRFVLLQTRSQKDRQTDKNTEKPRYNIVRTFPFGVRDQV